jgi:hypothetical protein
VGTEEGKENLANNMSSDFKERINLGTGINF